MAREIAFTEEDILDRARDLFWKQGYEATSIQDLERALGIRRSSIYNTFGDKRRLFERTLARYQEENLQRMHRMLYAIPDPRRALTEVFSAAATVADDDCLSGARGCYIVNTAAARANTCPDTLRFVSRNRERFTKLLRSFLRRAQEDGYLPTEANPGELANFLFLCYNGIQVLVKTGVDRSELQQSAAHGINSLPWTKR